MEKEFFVVNKHSVIEASQNQIYPLMKKSVDFRKYTFYFYFLRHTENVINICIERN